MSPLDRRSFVANAATLAFAAATEPTRAMDTLARPSIADDPLGVRADFPIVQTRTYLNNAYITPCPRQTVAAGVAFLESKATSSLQLRDMLGTNDQVRAKFARLINASPDEIGLLYTTSEGENIVANGLDWKQGDNVVIDELHYEAEFVIYRELAKRTGVELRIAKPTGGAVDAKAIEQHVDKRTRLVSLAWVSHANGYRHDMKAIAEIAHAHGALCYTDGIQAVGMIPIDVKEANVDFLACGTYKWILGGFGVAPFYVKREVLDRVRLDRFGALHIEKELPDHGYEIYKSAKRFDYATTPFAEVHILGAGIDYVQKVGVPRIEAHTVALAQRLQDGLASQGWELFTPRGNRSSIVTFFFTKSFEAMRAAFAAEHIDVTVRAREVRVAPALFNVDADVEKFLEVTKRLRA